MKLLYWFLALVAIAVVAVVAFAAGYGIAWYNLEGPFDEYELASSSLETLECSSEQLQQAVINLTVERDLDAGKVLKIYDEAEKSRTSRELRCSGLALTSAGTEDLVAIEYYVFEDADGDRFFGISYH